MLRTFLVCLCLLTYISVSAQLAALRSKADSLFLKAGEFALAAQQYRKLGTAWQQQGQRDSAYRAYFHEVKALSQSQQWEAALEVCEMLERPDWRSHGAQSHGALCFEKGFIESSLGKYEAAISSFDLALAEERKRASPSPIKIADIEQFKGINLMYAGRLQEAKNLVLRAHQARLERWPPDTLALAYSANNLNLLYSELHDFPKADIYIREALRILKLNLPPTHPHIAFLLNNSSTISRNLGDLHTAREQLLEAVSANSAAGRSYLLALNHYSLGNLHTDLGDIESAYTYLYNSYRIGDSTFANPSQDRANLYDGLGRVAWYRHAYKQADSLFRLGLNQKLQLGEARSAEVARSYHNLGLIAAAYEHWIPAAQLFQTSLSIRTKKLGAEHPLTLESQYRLAKCFWEGKEDPEALDMWKTCLRIYRKRNIPSTSGEVLVAFWLAQAYEQSAQSDSTEQYLKLAWSAMLGIPERIREWKEIDTHLIQLMDPLVFELIRFQLQHSLSSPITSADEKGETAQLILGRLDEFLPRMLALLSFQPRQNEVAQHLQSIYATAALLVHRADPSAGQQPAFFLRCIQHSKGFAIRSALQNRRAMQYARVPDSLIKHDIYLRAKVWATYRHREEWPKPAQSKRDIQVLDQWNLWQDQLAAEYPDYYHLQYQKPETDLEDLSHRLSQEQRTLLAYVHLDTLLLAITYDGRQMNRYELDMDNSWQDSLETFNSLISQRGDIRQLSRLAYYLYQSLIEPLSQSLNEKVWVLPDGPLQTLNFELLLSDIPAIDPLHIQHLPWLLYTYDFQYTHYLSSPGTKAPSIRPNLVLAPGFSPEIKQAYQKSLSDQQKADSLFLNWVSTPWSLQLASELDRQGWGNALLGQEATQSKFIDLSGQANIVHFATHAQVNDHKPLNSFLALYPDSNSAYDAYLYAHELYGLSLDNSLVVLSACETGTGAYQKGEGVLSLAHAFQYAGCPSLIFSLWSIDDQQTHHLFRKFYAHLDRGADISRSLRQAKIAYLQASRDELSHPYYWGSLIFTGENKTLETPHTYYFHGILLLGIMIGIALIGVIYQKKAKKIRDA